MILAITIARVVLLSYILSLFPNKNVLNSLLLSFFIISERIFIELFFIERFILS